MTNPLPPPVPGTAHRLTEPDGRPLPIQAAVGAIVVLTTSLVVSKLVLDAVVDRGWPIAVYVALVASIGYGPSLWWCVFVSRRWGTGRLGADIGLSPRWSDLGWGPVVWLAALGGQVVAALIVTAIGVPIASNTEAIDDASIDRTYVVAIVMTAVVAAPIVEEMVFRGVVLRSLRSRLPWVGAVALQAVLFGLAHVDPVLGSGNAGLVIVLSGVGVALGGAAVLLRRIGPSIVAHALFNGVVLLVVLTGVADLLREETSAVEEVRVVDQADATETGRHGDATPTRSAIVGVDPIEDLERVGIEHADVVDLGATLGVEDAARGGDDAVHGRRGGPSVSDGRVEGTGDGGGSSTILRCQPAIAARQCEAVGLADGR